MKNKDVQQLEEAYAQVNEIKGHYPGQTYDELEQSAFASGNDEAQSQGHAGDQYYDIFIEMWQDFISDRYPQLADNIESSEDPEVYNIPLGEFKKWAVGQ